MRGFDSSNNLRLAFSEMVMDETYVMNQVKEELCYVSTHFKEDMIIAKLVFINLITFYSLFY